MVSLMRGKLRAALVAALGGMTLAACSLFAPPAPKPPPAPPLPPVPSYDLVASIRAAGAREQSVITVAGVQDPGVVAMQKTAEADAERGQYADAAALLAQALKLSPDSPSLLQDRAELAIRQKDFPLAESYARKSYELGARFGSLCARNWQTVVEIRLQQRDLAGATAARKSVQGCHKPGVPRY